MFIRWSPVGFSTVIPLAQAHHGITWSSKAPPPQRPTVGCPPGHPTCQPVVYLRVLLAYTCHTLLLPAVHRYLGSCLGTCYPPYTVYLGSGLGTLRTSVVLRQSVGHPMDYRHRSIRGSPYGPPAPVNPWVTGICSLSRTFPLVWYFSAVCRKTRRYSSWCCTVRTAWTTPYRLDQSGKYRICGHPVVVPCGTRPVGARSPYVPRTARPRWHVPASLDVCNRWVYGS